MSRIEFSHWPLDVWSADRLMSLKREHDSDAIDHMLDDMTCNELGGVFKVLNERIVGIDACIAALGELRVVTERLADEIQRKYRAITEAMADE